MQVLNHPAMLSKDLESDYRFACQEPPLLQLDE